MSRMVSRHHDGGGTSSYVPGTSHGAHGGPRSHHAGSRNSKPSGGNGGGANPLSCNRCRKAILTTVFICKCDCLFCESCTYSHFSDNSVCPVCGMTLGAEDFLELCVADPSSRESSAKIAFQDMLTKSRSDATYLTHQDMCMHAIKSVDQVRRSLKFILKQMVLHQATHSQTAHSLQRAYEKLQAEHTQLQQATASERQDCQQRVQELQTRNSALTNQLQGKAQKLNEQQQQIEKFREHFRHATPGSSHSLGSSSNGKGRHPAQPPQQRGYSSENGINTAPAPPMHAFVKNKAMAAAAAATASRQSHIHKRPVLGSSQQPNTNYHPHAHHHHAAPSDSIPPFSATPIHLPATTVNSMGRPSSSGSSTGPRIRDLRGSSSYTFGNQHHHRSSSGTANSPAMIFSKSHREQTYQGFR